MYIYIEIKTLYAENNLEIGEFKKKMRYAVLDQLQERYIDEGIIHKVFCNKDLTLYQAKK